MTGAVSLDGMEPAMLPIENIAVGERIGFFNEGHAARLGKSMADEGQHAPIQVKRNGNAAKQPWTLVAGHHRLRGAALNGWTHIDAIQVADATAKPDDLRRMELSENLSHRFRRPIERAMMMAELARIEEAVDYPDGKGVPSQVRAGRARHSASVTVTDAGGWRERTAAAFGCSLSTFERHLRINKDIVDAMPDLAQALNDHPMGESLSAINRIVGIKMPDARRKAVTALLAKADWNSMDEVLASAGLAQSSGSKIDPRNYRATMQTAWEKMPVTDRRAYLEDLPGMISKDMAERLVGSLVKAFNL